MIQAVRKKYKQGVRNDVRKKGSKDQGRNYARKVGVNQQGVMQEMLQGSMQETFQDQQQELKKLFARKKHARKIAGNYARQCARKAHCLARKYTTKVARKQAGKYPTTVTMKQAGKHLQSSKERGQKVWKKVACKYSRNNAGKQPKNYF